MTTFGRSYSMQLTYGSYAHPSGETEITIIRESLFSPIGVRERLRERWTVRGRVADATTEDLTTAIAALEAAHSRDGESLTLRVSESETSAHQIESNRTLTGVRVARLSYPEGRGAEYATFRTYEVVYEAELPPEDPPGVIAWVETLAVSGGGPRFEHITCVFGPPVRVQVAEMTPFRCTQAGMAVGYSIWPEFPAPLFPAVEQRDRRRQEKVTPQLHGPRRARFPIRWSYELEAATAFFGVPTLP